MICLTLSQNSLFRHQHNVWTESIVATLATTRIALVVARRENVSKIILTMQFFKDRDQVKSVNHEMENSQLQKF